jgi:HEAT repeats
MWPVTTCLRLVLTSLAAPFLLVWPLGAPAPHLTLAGSPASSVDLYAVGTASLTDIQAERTQPAGAPVLLTITLTNVGNSSRIYWCGGPASYPDASWYMARVMDEHGKSRELPLSNGQFHEGSGGIREVKPGEQVVFPAAFDPLPAGSYTIQIGKGKSTFVTVKDDPERLRRRNHDILARIRKGEAFAQHLPATYPNKFLSDALLEDLRSEDDNVALQSASALFGYRELPGNAAARFNIAVRERLACRSGMLNYVVLMAAEIGSDEALEPVLNVAHRGPDTGTREQAVHALRKFPQERATRELRGFLKDQEPEMRFQAALSLADRKDAAGLDQLLTLAAKAPDRWREDAYRALANFPDDPRVETALMNGSKDTDPSVQSAANRALDTVRQARKPRRE